MPGYEIIERTSLQPYNQEGIKPYENKLGFIDFLREIRNEANDLPKLSSYMVVGIDVGDIENSPKNDIGGYELIGL